MNKREPKKTYQKPEVRRIRLSLAELTLGSNCDTNNGLVLTDFCVEPSPQCNI